MFNRRYLLTAGGLWLMAFSLDRLSWSSEDSGTVKIYMRSTSDGTSVSFDPMGLLVQPGRRIRWVNDGNNVHTATAYHPVNDRHPLRIPATAKPWDSGYLMDSGDSFEVRLTEEGIYDYYCIPHEAAGMVGRIIVCSEPESCLTTLTPYPDNSGIDGLTGIPKAALRNFPSIGAILQREKINGSLMPKTL